MNLFTPFWGMDGSIDGWCPISCRNIFTGISIGNLYSTRWLNSLGGKVIIMQRFCLNHQSIWCRREFSQTQARMSVFPGSTHPLSCRRAYFRWFMEICKQVFRKEIFSNIILSRPIRSRIFWLFFDEEQCFKTWYLCE